MISFLLLFIAHIPSTLLADLPVHCLRDQVLGTWDFKYSMLSSSYPALCHHAIPDNKWTMIQNHPSFHHPGFDVFHHGNFTLFPHHSKSSVACTTDLGCFEIEWTVVYDEFLNIRGKNNTFEALMGFKYEPAVESREVRDWEVTIFCLTLVPVMEFPLRRNIYRLGLS